MSVTINLTIHQFQGLLHKVSHDSEQTKTPMAVNIFLPPHPLALKDVKVPVLIYLSGLTCTPDNASEKSFVQYFAAKYGFAVVFPDTSPRGAGIAGEDDSWDLGTGAGFYVDATQSPWSENYRMYSYIHQELPRVLSHAFPVLDFETVSIMGHSMGGFGALSGFLKNPGMYKSVSAFAPICHPLNCGWGRKAFREFLGPDEASWQDYDPVQLIKNFSGSNQPLILIHQGAQDNFHVKDNQLQPDSLVKAAADTALEGKVDLRIKDGDHSYYFISSYIEDHAKHHAQALGCA